MRFGLTAFVLLLSVFTSAQCVVINEIMVNAAGQFDGAQAPNTAEWVELYNTCDTPVDIGCFVIADGDFTVTIPAGTILQPHGYYTFGSGNAGFAVNLNWATCGCTTGSASQVGIFTNGNEQLALVNGSGQLQDAVYWGSGQFPLNNTTSAAGGCSVQSLSFPNAAAGFEQAPGSSPDGCSIGRACDGSLTWQNMCGALITPGSSNTSPVAPPTFSASAQTICPGECIQFNGNSSITPDSWSWSFEGSSTPSSNIQNPAQICYPAIGTFDVTLTITTACGTSQTVIPDYITVQNNVNPVITADGPLTICPGTSVELQATTTASSYQWNFNNQPIPNATSSTYMADQAGNYSLTAGTGGCTGTSNILTVQINNVVAPVINEGSILNICTGETGTLTTQSGYSQYQWLLNDNPISNSNNSSLQVTTAGDYKVTATDAGGCTSTSSVTVVQLTQLTPPVITSSTGSGLICEGDVITLSIADNYDTYVWKLNGQQLTQFTGNSLTTGNDGDFTVTVQSGQCSVTSAIFTVSIQPAPIVSISPSGNVVSCNAQFTVTGTSNGSYQWYSANGIITGSTGSQLSVTEAGTYYFVSQSTAGCESVSESVTVSFSGNLTVNITTTDTSPCPGESVTMSVPAGFTNVVWSNNQTGNSITVNSGGIYSVTVTENSCTATDSETITYGTLPTAILNPTNDVTTCEDLFTLSATSNGSIQWILNEGDIPGSTGVNYNATESGTYSFVATGSNGCTATSNQVTVTFTEGLEIEIIATATSVCVGQSITLSIDGNYDNILWSNSQTGSSITVTSGNFYSVEVTDNGCIGESFIELTFLPLPSVNAGNDTITDCDNGVMLMGTGTGVLTWLPSESLENPESAITLVTPTVNTVYTLIATQNGCSASDQILVEADCTSLFIPNVFTPNGDGKNDYFEIQARGIKTFELKIFNRWGQLIFETDDPNKPWTGGKDYYAPDGTYFWTVIALDQNNKPVLDEAHSHGTVTVLR